jgi:hypothetical protein
MSIMTQPVQRPRQSTAYLLVMARLDDLIQAKRTESVRADSGERSAAAGAVGAEMDSTPDGNHGGNNFDGATS